MMSRRLPGLRGRDWNRMERNGSVGSGYSDNNNNNNNVNNNNDNNNHHHSSNNDNK